MVDDSIWMSPGRASDDSFSPSCAWLRPAHHCVAAPTASTSTTRPMIELRLSVIALRRLQ
ncbi:MAG: hypothetical protein MUF08_17265 [Burkholderiaceae bacterium]|nr:hypothetical protein [Burkholderiaceae bacterium]